MGELIFFAVIILFSILESIARKKKAGQQVPVPGEPESVDWDEDEGSILGDRFPDQTEDFGAPGGELSEYMRPSGGTSEGEGRSSESMIPAEIWEEISGLTGGRGAGVPTRPSPRRPTRPREQPTEPAVRVATSSRERGPARPEHRVHLAHALYGTDPSSRPPSEQDTLDPFARSLSADAAQVRNVLSGRGGAHALRQAIILHEVLGPPPSLRDE